VTRSSNARLIRRLAWLFALLPTLCLSAPELPAAELSAAELERQRGGFLAAERLLAAGDLQQYAAIRSTLRSYPLFPYLEYQALQRQLASLDSPRVEAFITRYADTPLAPRMRSLWLKELAERKQWWTYLAFHRPGLGTIYQCHYLTALLETGKRQQALDQAETIWLSPRSRPEACDRILQAWIDANKLTPALAWQRVELAMQASEGRFTRYLGRYLSPQQQAWLRTWRELQRDPRQLATAIPRLAESPARNRILLDGFKRLVHRDIDSAIRVWPRLQEQIPFSAADRYSGQRALLLGMIRDDHPDSLTRLRAFTPSAEDNQLRETRLRYALKRRAWPQLLSWIGELPDELRNSDRWRYWQARALAETANTAAADARFAALAKERSYHGFLAADRLGQPYRYDPTPLELQQSGIAQLAQQPALLRARELFQLDRFLDARREWYASVRDMKPLDLQRVAKLAQSWGWHDQAIFTLARTGYWDDLELRFPLEHQTLVTETSVATDLNKSWIFAVIRQESAFSSDAQSPAGARGLMQLMPATARFIARKEKLKKPGLEQLLRPEVNITLGTAYLSHVYRRLGEHQVLATAAYNAGPRNVLSWLPDTTLPADIWVELIPFNETRRYTERVLSYAAIYDQRLQQPLQRLSARMSPVRPKDQLVANNPPGGGGS
jgi:soluble lytic murein transglycosylase